MKPLFTFLVPCYNGEQFINNSFHSLMNERLLNEDVMNMYEVILISDGSTDGSLELANKWANEWNQKVRKNFVKIIDKPNGQYGSVINKGLKIAKGVYFKVLDVDDTFNVSSLIKLLYTVIGFRKQVDVIFTDHTYEKVGSNKQELLSWRNNFEPNKFLNIKKTSLPNDLITMHSIIYRTEILKEIKYKQIEGIFYSDSQYALVPLTNVNIIYYIQIPLYRYYIGRDEQSVNLKVMVKNMEHQFIVRRKILKEIDFTKIKSSTLRSYYHNCMRQMVQWSIMLIAFNKNVQNKQKEIRKVILDTRKLQPKEHKNINNKPYLGFVIFTRGKGIGWMTRIGLKIYSQFKKNILAEWD